MEKLADMRMDRKDVQNVRSLYHGMEHNALVAVIC